MTYWRSALVWGSVNERLDRAAQVPGPALGLIEQDLVAPLPGLLR